MLFYSKISLIIVSLTYFCLPFIGGNCSSSLYCSLINLEEPCCLFTRLDRIACLCKNGLIGASAESEALLARSLSKLADRRPVEPPAGDFDAASGVNLEAGDTGLSDLVSDAEFGESIVGDSMGSFQSGVVDLVFRARFSHSHTISSLTKLNF